MENELYHYGVLGMKWGVRRYRNEDGSLTQQGKKKYQLIKNKKIAKAEKEIAKYDSELNKYKDTFYRSLHKSGVNSNKTIRAAEKYTSRGALAESNKAISELDLRQWERIKLSDIPDELRRKGRDYYDDLFERKVDFAMESNRRLLQEVGNARFNHWLFNEKE